jgi:hypothetical protein|tara:strand:- start:520 stop:828 length:309 start_codon:yes stop_codon:yes gene_type:complete
LVVGVLGLQFLDLVVIIFLLSVSRSHILFLKLFLLLQERFDLSLVVLDDVVSFSEEGLLDLVELLGIISPHIDELLLHRLDKFINIIVLLFQGFDVFFILAL